MDQNIYYIFQSEEGQNIFEYISQAPPPDIGENVRLRDHRDLAHVKAAEFEVIDVEEFPEVDRLLVIVTVEPLE